MEEWYRRSVLATGAALSLGGVASISAGASETDDLPNPELDPNPELGEDWASYSGDAGHARFVRDGYEFDGESLEVAWSVDQTGSVAIADDTVYTTTEDGVVALDAADGSLVWENTDVDAYSPAVVGEMVYLRDDEIVALDREDGSVRWESDLGPEEWTSSHTVAYDGVYVVVDGTLYALEADDGSVRWQKDSALVESSDGDEQASEFITGTAAANGVVYAGTRDAPLGFDPATGDEVWQGARRYQASDTTGNSIQATTTAVLVKEYSNGDYVHYDAQTGERLFPIRTHNAPALSDESTIAGDDQGYGSRSIRGDEFDWGIDVTYTYGYRPVISGETVYVYFIVDGHNYGDRDYDRKLVALDKHDGSEKWAISRDDAPVGHVRAISDETIYVDHDGELVALRERADDEDAGESDDANGDEDAPDDTGEDADGDAGEEDDEDADDGDSDCPNAGSDSECGGDDSSGGSDDDDDGLGDAGGDGNSDDGGADDGDEDGDGPTESGMTDDEDDADDGVPGFTAGAGLLGGALGLEWLRRRDDADEPAE